MKSIRSTKYIIKKLCVLCFSFYTFSDILNSKKAVMVFKDDTKITEHKVRQKNIKEKWVNLL